ncbi:hypothetical protein F7D08_1309 [Bifidobacterium cebidarum]|uniref:Sugar ABC transporter substrate-binding protein n=2 Tax=Bifidobacterium cebidarum TaxID=2650773 RepID=A0A6I1GF60_9BIFI|nr:hypothetical protein [Bifidobacterium cebidarum]KAB7787915.1 hypothetical protein F7D08_1309 [Bifidobacterium cebidarum]
MTVVSLSACTPVNRAVGDTQDTTPEVAHDSVHASDAEVGFVGSEDSAADKLAIDALADEGINVYYAAFNAADDGGAATAQQSVSDFVARSVDLVVISGFNITGTNNDSWVQTLTNAREAGIPVALLNPSSLPDDDLLYAASLTVNDRDANASRISDAVMTIIHDEPHERSIAVSTVS